MITSSNGNQYLTPDYMSPLPTMLDSKNSPLALLAQTCSQIGADSSSMKSISSSDKSKKSDSRDKASPASSISSCSPVTSKSSFKPYESLSHKDADDKSVRVKTPSKLQSHSNSRCSSKESASSGSGGSTSSPGTRKTPATTQELPATSRPEDTPASKAPVSAGYLGYPCSLPLDVMASGLLSYPKPGTLNPYLGYTRMKTVNGSEAVVPVCRDPYCAGCQLSSHLLGGKLCPAGCTQCDGKQLPAHAHSHAHAQSSIATAYAHAQLAALAAASQLPYVCSWIAGEATYCGKRFATSEELLQHLRTHTSDMLGSPTHPILSRSYPTPPLSPLATARYHPYSKPSLLPPGLSSSFPLHPPSSLPPYFPPYSLYGPRLSTSQSMHP
nr:PREDICTED: zinc finger protein Elbow [Bemisia tabaci]